jgi:hypothetical protein
MLNEPLEKLMRETSNDNLLGLDHLDSGSDDPFAGDVEDTATMMELGVEVKEKTLA